MTYESGSWSMRMKALKEGSDNRIGQLEERVKQLESALRFYADNSNYSDVQFGSTVYSAVEADAGERARVTLYGRYEPEDS